MTTTVQFREVLLITSSQRHSYTFGQGVNLIVGPVGAGKTSLLELLRFGIGGNGVLSQAAEQAVQRVTVTVWLGSGTYLLSRRVGSNLVEVLSRDGTPLETFSTQQSKRYRPISEFLLEAAGLPAVRLASSGVRPTSKTEPLSFFDVFSFCYLPQSEIDRSVTRHADPMRARKRKATFELLFGLSDVETAAAERLVGELNDRLSEARQRESTVRTFLEQVGERSEPSLVAERQVLEKAAMAARRQLSGLREDLRSVTADEAARRDRLAAFARHLREVQDQVRERQTELASHTQLLAQLDLDLQRLGRARSARAALRGIEFTQCPRCMQSLADVAREPGHCVLCGQPEPSTVAADLLAPVDDDAIQLSLDQQWGANDERRRIQAMIEEVQELATQDQSGLDDVLAQQRALEASLHEMELDLDERTRSYVSPRFEAIADLSSQVAAAEARQHAIDLALGYWTRHREIVADVSVLEQDFAEARRRLEQSRAVLFERKSRVVELSQIFDEIVRLIEPPWYESAYIDLNSYLPVVHGAQFDQLSGGEKTITNFAYQLAMLTYALSSRTTLLPALLVMDTPRKNLGSGLDQALAARMYRRVAVLADAYPGAFQLVVADNDPPPVVLPSASTIELSYEHPLIPDLQHPGPSVETVSSRMERRGPHD